MSKRLQVVLSAAEWREIRRIARQRHTTISEWVRQTLRSARRAEPLGSASAKLEVVRAAARHAFPTADIGQMLAEIERGYRSGA